MGGVLGLPTQDNLKLSGVSQETIDKLVSLQKNYIARNSTLNAREKEIAQKNADIALRLAQIEAKESAESDKLTALAKQTQESIIKQYEGQLETIRQPLEAAKKEYADIQAMLENLKQQKADLEHKKREGHPLPCRPSLHSDDGIRLPERL